jgi:hypothetical protein
MRNCTFPTSNRTIRNDQSSVCRPPGGRGPLKGIHLFAPIVALHTHLFQVTMTKSRVSANSFTTNHTKNLDMPCRNSSFGKVAERFMEIIARTIPSSCKTRAAVDSPCARWSRMPPTIALHSWIGCEADAWDFQSSPFYSSLCRC